MKLPGAAESIVCVALLVEDGSGTGYEGRPNKSEACAAVHEDRARGGAPRRHAKATEVEISLTFNESAVELCIRDNGVGFKSKAAGGDEKKRGAFGLISMRERARGLGGTLEVQSGRGKGTLVTVVIPTSKEVS